MIDTKRMRRYRWQVFSHGRATDVFAQAICTPASGEGDPIMLVFRSFAELKELASTMRGAVLAEEAMRKERRATKRKEIR